MSSNRIKHAASRRRGGVDFGPAAIAALAALAVVGLVALAWRFFGSRTESTPGEHGGGTTTATEVNPFPEAAAGEQTDPPEGNIEFMIPLGSQLVISGWALDWDDPDQPLHVKLFLDGVEVETTTADGERLDVAAQTGTNGNHGFEFTLDLPPGDYHSCVYVENIPSGDPVQLSCETVTVE